MSYAKVDCSHLNPDAKRLKCAFSNYINLDDDDDDDYCLYTLRKCINSPLYDDLWASSVQSLHRHLQMGLSTARPPTTEHQ